MGIIQFFVSARKLETSLFFLWHYHSVHTLPMPHPAHAMSACSLVPVCGISRRHRLQISTAPLGTWELGRWISASWERRWTVLEEAADPAFVLQDLSPLRAHPPLWIFREVLENKNISCFINLCILKLSAIMICLPEEKVVVLLEGMQERSKGASQGHTSVLSLPAYSISNFYKKVFQGKSASY